MKNAAFGKCGNANMRGKLSMPWADDTLHNVRNRERQRLADRDLTEAVTYVVEEGDDAEARS